MKKMFGFYAVLILTAFVSFVFALEVTKQDSNFMMKAAQSDMMEIAASNLALQKSQNDNVRRFAQMIVDDHTKTSDQLKSIAATKNVTLPADMNAKQKSMVDKLSGLSGDKFDMEYIKGQVKAHEAAVKLFRSQYEKGTDADVHVFTGGNLPVLQTHLAIARAMSDDMKNMKSDMKSGSGNSNSNSNSNRNTNSNSNSNSNSNMNHE